MTISIPEELYAFGVTSKDYDEKRSVLAKSTETEINENEVFWDLFQDSAEKAVNYEILQMLYLEYGQHGFVSDDPENQWEWQVCSSKASMNPNGTNSLQAVKGTLGNYLKQ